ELAARGFRDLATCARGVDTTLFRPRADADLGLPRPVSPSVGRVAPEKSVEDFLRLDLPGTKVVAGDGPDRARLEAAYPEAVFAGTQRGEDLARHYAAADLFVFPSRTDTFGLVVLEALASGLPVAAYPVTGPVDIIGGTDAGVLDDNLQKAAVAALAIPRDRPRRLAETFSWEKVTSSSLPHSRRSRLASGPRPVTPPRPLPSDNRPRTEKPRRADRGREGRHAAPSAGVVPAAMLRMRAVSGPSIVTVAASRQ